MNFDFLSDDDGPKSHWDHEPDEYRDAGMVDAAGKRIGYKITRSIHLRRGDATPHVRWVSVTKDGEWIRNDYSKAFATREQAEQWVEKRISESIARYRRASSGASAAPAITSRAGRSRSKSRSRVRLVLVVLAIILAAPIVAAMFIAAAVPR